VLFFCVTVGVSLHLLCAGVVLDGMTGIQVGNSTSTLIEVSNNNQVNATMAPSSVDRSLLQHYSLQLKRGAS
jgi:hypothetical protein